MKNIYRVLQSRSGYTYVDVPNALVQPYRDQIVGLVGVDKASDMFQQLSARPSGSGFHMTVLSPREFRQVKKTGVCVPETTVAFDMVGLGRAVEGDKEVWFIVCESIDAQGLRDELGFGPKEFHITLGFVNGDIFTEGVKGRASLVTK